LHAQSACNSQSGAGNSTTFAFYTPGLGPVSKAPVVPFPSPSLSPLPVMSLQNLLSIKTALAPFVHSTFPGPPQVQFFPVPVRAPGTTNVPIALAPTASFQGIVQPGPVQIDPPSPDIAVGPSDVLMVVNSSIAQFTKAGVLEQNTQFQDFFSALLPTICPDGASSCQIFDPSIRYDQLHGRFLFLATSRDTNTTSFLPSYLLLSVSNGATSNSGWKTWVMNVSLDGSTSTSNYGDFWRFGFDNTSVYLAGNMYQNGQFQYAKIRVVKKSDLYNLSAATLPYQDLFGLTNEDGSLADSITPAHQRGKPSAGNSPVLVSTNNVTPSPPPNYLTVWKIDPTTTPLGCTHSTVTVMPYDVPAPVPQLGTTTVLDGGDRRILKAVYRNGFLYTARDSGYQDAAITVTYDVIDTSNMSLVSQARILNSNSFYPVFDVPATTASGAPFASPITGTTSAPDGTQAYPSISFLKAGKAFYDYTGGESSATNKLFNRWGDYFGGAVDPITGGLWASGQYAETQVAGYGEWGTWAGYFPWLTTPAFTDVPSSNPFADYINVMSLWQITSGCTATTFCPTTTVNRSQFAAFLIRSMEGNSFTYTTTPYFTDVLASDPSFPYVQKLRDLGITSGCTATTFCPDDLVPRWAAATLLVRAKLKALFGDNFAYPATPSFEDVAPTSSAFPYIQKLFELGVTTGCTATEFCPDDPITRQQAAAFIVRAFLN